jgi:hypothetical protein
MISGDIRKWRRKPLDKEKYYLQADPSMDGAWEAESSAAIGVTVSVVPASLEISEAASRVTPELFTEYGRPCRPKTVAT